MFAFLLLEFLDEVEFIFVLVVQELVKYVRLCQELAILEGFFEIFQGNRVLGIAIREPNLSSLHSCDFLNCSTLPALEDLVP